MKNVLSRITAAMLLFGIIAGPAYAYIDDGTGCGCIRPCPWIIER